MSKEAVVTSIVPGSRALSYVSGLPHKPQNLRVTPGED